MTTGIELSENLDGLNCCPSYGWNAEKLVCSAGPGEHLGEICYYLCANCGADMGITTQTVHKIEISTRVKRGVSSTDSPGTVSIIDPHVYSMVGEVLIGYAIAENNLRAMLKKASIPKHNPHSTLWGDIDRLKGNRSTIVAQASANLYDDEQTAEDCIDAIVDTFSKTYAGRNTLAHGRMVHISLVVITIRDDDPNRGDDRGSRGRLQIEHKDEVVELTEDGILGLLDNVRELQASVEHLGRIVGISNRAII